MSMKCLVVRGLAKEVEEDLNKFFASRDVHVLHMTQSSTGEYISVTLVYADPSRVG
jgi:putative lipoic acid-binding regulatory protein